MPYGIRKILQPKNEQNKQNTINAQQSAMQITPTTIRTVQSSMRCGNGNMLFSKSTKSCYTYVGKTHFHISFQKSSFMNKTKHN